MAIRGRCAIPALRSSVVETVMSLVLRARLRGWSRELATLSLVTGFDLIPFGRLPLPGCSRADGLCCIDVG
jgi:hypothetical protein